MTLETYMNRFTYVFLLLVIPPLYPTPQSLANEIPTTSNQEQHQTVAFVTGTTSNYDLLLLTSVSSRRRSTSGSGEWTPTPDRQLAVFLTTTPTEPSSSSSDDHENASLVIELPTLSPNNSVYTHVALDVTGNTLYWSTNKGCVGFLKLNDKHVGVIHNDTTTSVSGLEYAAGHVYWIEGDRTIKSWTPSNTDSTVRVLVNATTDQEILRGIAVENKTGTLYYTTRSKSDRTNATLWSMTQQDSSLQSNPLVSNLHAPSYLTVSSSSKVYWIGNPHGIYFTVESMNSDKTGSTVIAKQPHLQANSLAVTWCTDQVYWTDSTSKRLWVKQETAHNNVPGGSRVLLNRALQDLRFAQVVAVPQLHCRDHAIFNNDDVTTTSTTTTATTTTAKAEKAIMSSLINAQKITTTTANPELQIRVCGYDELTACEPNNVCIVIGESTVPVCLLQESTPTRAPEYMNASRNATRNAVMLTATALGSRNNDAVLSVPWPPEVIIIISVLSTIAIIMSLISLYMTIRVRTLSRKPIIRRRLVVSTRTSESSSSSPASVCEMIDIENCCNMNVCETPCYERTLLQPQTSQSCSSSTAGGGGPIVSVNSSNSNWSGGCGKKDGSGNSDKRCLLS